jgi:hypothetical protein
MGKPYLCLVVASCWAAIAADHSYSEAQIDCLAFQSAGLHVADTWALVLAGHTAPASSGLETLGTVDRSPSEAYQGSRLVEVVDVTCPAEAESVADVEVMQLDSGAAAVVPTAGSLASA